METLEEMIEAIQATHDMKLIKCGDHVHVLLFDRSVSDSKQIPLGASRIFNTYLEGITFWYQHDCQAQPDDLQLRTTSDAFAEIYAMIVAARRTGSQN